MLKNKRTFPMASRITLNETSSNWFIKQVVKILGIKVYLIKMRDYPLDGGKIAYYRVIIK